MKNMKLILIGFLFLLTTKIYADDLRFIVSRIDNQEVIINSRTEVNFSSLNNTKEVIYDSPNMPSFVKIINLKKGYGKFVFEPKKSDVGVYYIDLKGVISSTGAIHNQKFKLTVVDLDKSSNVYYIDPINGLDTNDGSYTSPFKTISKITDNSFDIDGSVVYLRSGNYGKIDFSRSNSKMVYVVAEEGQHPLAENIRFNFSSNWSVSGFKISPSVASNQSNSTYVVISGGSRNIVMKNCEIFGTPNISDWPTNSDWDNYAGNGIDFKGKYCSFRSNYIYNTDFPVQVFGKYNDISYNLVVNFAGDAMRGLGDYNSFTYNQIKNAVVYDYYDAGGNHDDAFQSWTVGNPVVGIVFKGNQITDISYPELPLQTKIMQGIVDFDGFAEDWVIQDNLVVIHHQHGITILGAKNCRIVNNSVIKNPFKIYNNGDPWIGIWPTKSTAGSKKSTGNLVRNNIYGAFTDTSPPAPQGYKDVGDVDHNYGTTHFTNIFIDYSKWDFHLKANTVAIDKGEKDGSDCDIEGYIRNKGVVDLGCFERNASEIDFEKPGNNGTLIVDEIGPTHAKLSWMKPTDNKGIKLYHVLFEDREIIVDEPRCFVTDLYSNNDYTFNVYAEDLVGNKSNIETIKITTPDFDDDNYTIYSGGNKNDVEITNKNNKKWTYAQNLKVGGTDEKTDLAGVLVFKIPSIPYGKKIVGANLSLYFDERVGFPSGAVDLYGLDYERKEEIKDDVYWQGSFDDSKAIGVPLKDDFIGQLMQNGYIESDSIASANILNYFNLQLENGAHGGNYLFFRLNVDEEDEAKDSYYRIVSSDNYSSFKRPLLKLILEHTTANENQFEENIVLFPNPVNDILTLKNIEGSFKVEILDMVGNIYLYHDNVKSFSTTELKKGFYFVRIKNGNRVIVKSFVKI